jgi:hypothetical protein
MEMQEGNSQGMTVLVEEITSIGKLPNKAIATQPSLQSASLPIGLPPPSRFSRERTHTDNEAPVSDIYPMPKWPVNHTSAAFEAVAIKKSTVLSPAEIYAECVHHGKSCL